MPEKKERTIGLFEQRHLQYLWEYRKITYTNLLTSGKLNACLAEMNRQAQERFERLICKENRIDGAMNFNCVWLIPQNAKKPMDGRTLRGKQKDNIENEI